MDEHLFPCNTNIRIEWDTKFLHFPYFLPFGCCEHAPKLHNFPQHHNFFLLILVYSNLETLNLSLILNWAKVHMQMDSKTLDPKGTFENGHQWAIIADFPRCQGKPSFGKFL